MACEWAWLASTCGFKDVPPRTAGRLPRMSDAIRGIPDAPILCSSLGERLCIAVNGQLFAVPAGLGIEHVVGALNAGRSMPVAAICLSIRYIR